MRTVELEISLFLLRRLLGVKTEDKKQTKVSKLVKNELLLINIGSTSTGGRVLSVKGDLAKIQLTSPACTEVGEKVALSRRIEKHWRLVGECSFCCRSFGRFVGRGLIGGDLRRMGQRAARDGPGGGLEGGVDSYSNWGPASRVHKSRRTVALEACLIYHLRAHSVAVSILSVSVLEAEGMRECTMGLTRARSTTGQSRGATQDVVYERKTG